MDLLAGVRRFVFVVSVGFQRFAAVADVVVVHFEPSDVVVSAGDVRGQATAGTDRFQVFRVRDLHDFVLVAVLPVVCPYAQEHGDGDADVPRCFH